MNAQHVWSALRAKFVVVVIATIIGGALGWAVFASTPPSYKSNVTVTLIASGPSDVRGVEPNSSTEAAIAQSSVVVERAGKALGLKADEIASLYGAVEADSPAQSWTVRIGATGSSSEQSATRANAVAKAYVAYRTATNEQAEARIKSELDGMAKLAGADERMREVIMERRVRLVTGGQIVPTLVSPASTAGTPQGPGLIGYVAGGAVLGLFAGVALALILARRSGLHLAPAASAPGADPAEVPVATVAQSQAAQSQAVQSQAGQGQAAQSRPVSSKPEQGQTAQGKAPLTTANVPTPTSKKSFIGANRKRK